MRPGTAAALLLAMLSAPTGARSVDVELGVDATGNYDDGVIAEQGDFHAGIGPRLRAIDEDGELQWEVKYSPRYRKYLDLDDLDGWDQRADGRLSWRLSPGTTLRVSDQYSDVSGFSRVFSEDDLGDGTEDTGLEFGREQSRRNSAQATLEHVLAPRHVTLLSYQRYDTLSQSAEESETEVNTGTATYTYLFRRTDQLGLILRFTRQTVSNAGLDVEQDTDYYNASFTWGHVFDPTMNLQVAVGPTWVQGEPVETPGVVENQFRYPVVTVPGAPPPGISPLRASSCPRLDDGALFVGAGCEPFTLAELVGNSVSFETTDLPVLGADQTSDTLTYFASVSLTKRWERVDLTLRYVRDASTTTEVGGVVRDVLSLGLLWRPSQRWRISFNGSYEMREQPTDRSSFVQIVEPASVGGLSDVAEAVSIRQIATESNLEADRYLAGVFFRYSLRRDTSLFANLIWTREEVQGGFFEPRSRDRFRASVGVTFYFPRFTLPI